MQADDCPYYIESLSQQDDVLVKSHFLANSKCRDLGNVTHSPQIESFLIQLQHTMFQWEWSTRRPESTCRLWPPGTGSTTTSSTTSPSGRRYSRVVPDSLYSLQSHLTTLRHDDLTTWQLTYCQFCMYCLNNCLDLIFQWTVCSSGRHWFFILYNVKERLQLGYISGYLDSDLP